MLSINVIREKINQFVTRQEESKIPFVYYFLTFIFIVTLRNFFDTITDTTMSSPTRFSIGLSTRVSEFSMMNIVSNSLWYLGLALLLILILYFAANQKIIKVAKLVLPGFIVLLSVSFFDTLLSLGIGFDQAYMLPGVHENILQRWITFSIPFSSYGVTPGMKIETFLVIISVFGYVFVKTSSILRSLISGFVVYSAVFFWGCMPFAIKGFVEFFNIEYVLTPTLIVNFTLLLILIFGTIAYHLYNKKYIISILKDMDPFRVLHYLLMFVIGISIGLYAKNGSFSLNNSNLFQFIFAPAAIVFAGIFALVINGLADKKIDSISNPQRSLIDGTITVSHFIYIGIVSFFVAILYSVVLGHVTLLVILLLMGNYFIYSAPPLRLKRVPLFSKFFISLNSLILIMLGYYYITGTTNVHYLTVVAFLGGFTVLINFIDLKDYDGDKKEGIKTIPTLIGLKKSKILFGAFFLIGFISFGLFFENMILLAIMIILGIIEFYLMMREPYQEKYVFGTYILTLLIVIIFILSQNVYVPIA